MEIEHNPKADVMHIRFNKKPFHKNKVLAEDGTVFGIELISPSQFVDNLREIIYRLEDESAAVSSSGG